MGISEITERVEKLYDAAIELAMLRKIEKHQSLGVKGAPQSSWLDDCQNQSKIRPVESDPINTQNNNTIVFNNCTFNRCFNNTSIEDSVVIKKKQAPVQPQIPYQRPTIPRHDNIYYGPPRRPR